MAEYTDAELRKGRRLLKEVLPRIKAEIRKSRADKDSPYLQPENNTSNAMLMKVRLENIEALVVYCRNDNEWHADVLLKNMGVGIPHVLGTHSARPYSSAESARKAGLMILKGVVTAAMDNEIASRDKKHKETRYFMLYNLEVEFDGSLIENVNQQLEAARTMAPELVPDVPDIIDQLECRLKEYFGDTGFSKQAMDALDDEKRMRLLANIVQLVCYGVHRYPEYGREPIGIEPDGMDI